MFFPAYKMIAAVKRLALRLAKNSLIPGFSSLLISLYCFDSMFFIAQVTSLSVTCFPFPLFFGRLVRFCFLLTSLLTLLQKASFDHSEDLVDQGTFDLRPEDWTLRRPLPSPSSKESGGSSAGDDDEDAANDAANEGDQSEAAAEGEEDNQDGSDVSADATDVGASSDANTLHHRCL